MKTVFLASVAAATLIAAPALAQDAVGSIGLGYAHTDTEGFKTDGAVLDGVAAFNVAPEWTVTVNGDNHHIAKTAHIGQIREDGLIEPIHSSDSPIEPDPYLEGYDWYNGEE